MLRAAGCPPSVPGLAAGAGDPVQTAGVVPGTVDACCGDEHALTSATQAARRNGASLGIA
jgi:hypothetical protein